MGYPFRRRLLTATQEAAKGLAMPLGLAVVWGLNRLLNVLVDDEWVWIAHDISLSLSFTLAALIIVRLTPYNDIRQKCIAALIAGCAMADVIFSACKFGGYLGWITCQVLIGVALASFYWYRSHLQPSDALEPGHLFCIRHIPSSPQDFLISLSGIYGPNGGYSLFANGYLYKFSNGRLVRRKVTTLPAISYHVIRGSRATPEMIGELDSMIGMRWTWRKNCLTTLAPIWRKHRG